MALFYLIKKVVTEETNLIKIGKSLTLKDIMYSVLRAWDTVKRMSLVCVWHDLLGDDADDKVFDNFENSEKCVAEMQSILLHWVTTDSESWRMCGL